jgi:hypothetical protein
MDVADTGWVPTPAAEPRAVAKATPEGPLGFELGALAGVTVSGEGLGAGPAVGVEGVLRYRLGGYALTFGLRPGLERYATSSNAACGAGPTPSIPGCGAGYGYDLEEDLFTVGVPITLRLGGPTARVVPYLGIAPELIVERFAATSTIEARTTGITEGHARFGGHAFLGGQLRVGAGGWLFLEMGGRYATVESRPGGDTSLDAFLAQLGYRLSL